MLIPNTPSPLSSDIRKKRLLLFLITACSGVLILFCIDAGHDWGDDFALYIAETKAILGGSLSELYHTNRLAMEQSFWHLGPYLYPIGFPLLLTPLYLVFGVNFVAFKVYCGLFLIGSVWLLDRLFKADFHAPWVSLILLAMVAFNYHFVSHANYVLSDLPYVWFSLLCLWLIRKERSVAGQVLLGGLIFFSYLIRDIGIVLLPTLLAFQWQQNYGKKIAWPDLLRLSIPYVVFGAGFLIDHAFLPGVGENHMTAFFTNLGLQPAFAGIKYYLKLIPSFFFAGYFPTNVEFILFTPFFFLLGTGMFICRKTHLYLVVYLTLTLLILCIWPWKNTRFLFPAIPIIIFFTLKGTFRAAQALSLGPRVLQGGLALFLAVYLALNLPAIIAYGRAETNDIKTPEMLSIYRFIEENLPENSIVGFKKPRMMRLMTDRQSIATDPETFDQSVADYLVLEKEFYLTSQYRHAISFETPNFLILEKDR